MKNILLSFIFSVIIVSCGSDQKESETMSTPASQTEQPQISNQIELRATDDMKFDKTQFTVKAGEEITLTFTNTGVLPIESMGHNVVILEKTADVAQFANASARAKETDYISHLYVTDIIAHTKLLGPGESDTIQFTLKEPGEYIFICSFPGHWAAMKGTITAV